MYLAIKDEMQEAGKAIENLQQDLLACRNEKKALQVEINSLRQTKGELTGALQRNQITSEGILQESALTEAARNQAQTKRQLEETTRRLDELKRQQAKFKEDKELQEISAGQLLL